MLTYSKYGSGNKRRSGTGLSVWKMGWLLFICTSSILIILLIANWLIANDVLRVKRVQVLGLYMVEREEILKLAQIDTSKNVYELDFKSIAARVKNHSLVQDAKVGMRLPSTVVIELIEREPLALVRDSKLIPIDENGHALPELGEALFHDYPIISNLAKDDGENFQKVVEFLRRVKQQHFALYSQISEISYSQNMGVYFFLINGAVPVFVGDGDWLQKGANFMQVYEIISAEQPIANIEYFDLRFANQVVVKELQ